MECRRLAVDDQHDTVTTRKRLQFSLTGSAHRCCRARKARANPFFRQTILAATGSWRKGGRPGSATSRFHESTQRKPVGSTRAMAETSSRVVVAIGWSRIEVATRTANELSVSKSRCENDAGSPSTHPTIPWV